MSNSERIYAAAFPDRPLEDFERVEVLILVSDGTEVEGYGCSDGCCTVDEIPADFTVQVNIISTKELKVLVQARDPEWNVFKPAAERPGMDGYFYSAEGVYGSYGNFSDKFKAVNAGSVVVTKTFKWQHAAMLLRNLFVEDDE
jgi:hypothetical protein